MEFHVCNYDNNDIEKSKNLEQLDKDVKKAMKKEEKPSVKPSEVFEGYVEKKGTKKKITIPRKKIMSNLKFEKKKDSYVIK